MAKLLKLRRGTTSQHSSFTGAEGEVTVDTTKDTIVVHDGSTAGGVPLAKESDNLSLIDEDNMSTNSASRPPSQQSVKAYVDAGDAAVPTTITVADESSDTSCNVLFTTAATGDLAPKSGTNLTFNSSTGMLTSTGFTGALTGNATTATALASSVDIGGVAFDGSASINLPGVNIAGTANTSGNAATASSCTGNAATATTATNVTVADESSDTSCNVLFTTAATGDLPPKSGTNLTFNSSTGELESTILKDSIGSVRSLGATSSNTTLAVSDVGKVIALTSGTVTVPNSTFAQGDIVSIYNYGSSNITITGNTSSWYWAADGTSANRTLAPKGMATIYFLNSTWASISGSGLT